MTTRPRRGESSVTVAPRVECRTCRSVFKSPMSTKMGSELQCAYQVVIRQKEGADGQQGLACSCVSEHQEAGLRAAALHKTGIAAFHNMHGGPRCGFRLPIPPRCGWNCGDLWFLNMERRKKPTSYLLIACRTQRCIQCCLQTPVFLRYTDCYQLVLYSFGTPSRP
jgi:hypothetical protein